MVTSQYVVQCVPYVKAQVKTIYAQPNQPLKKGDLPLEIDPAPYQYTVSQVETLEVSRCFRSSHSRKLWSTVFSVNTITNSTTNYLRVIGNSGVTSASNSLLNFDVKSDLERSYNNCDSSTGSCFVIVLTSLVGSPAVTVPQSHGWSSRTETLTGSSRR